MTEKTPDVQRARVAGPDDILIATALVLLTVGLWSRIGVAALIAPGLVLLWLALPPRHAFVVKRPADALPHQKGRA